MTTTTAPMTLTDADGNPITGGADAVTRYDEAVDLLLRYHPDVVEAAGNVAADPQALPMGQVFMAYLGLTTSDVPALDGARAAAGALEALPLNDREAAHAAAVNTWLDGDWHGAARVLDDLLVRWPTDVLALQIGQLLDFFVGDAQNLRDRIGRSMPRLDPDSSRTGFVRGLYAFGLEEAGHYERAEAVGLAALHRNPKDVWGTHAVVHSYEMRGQVDDGIRFLRAREADWGTGNLFTVHNWWHLALYLLEAGRYDEALAIYDAEVHHDGSEPAALPLIDASSLLWRVTLDGVDTGDRYDRLADVWADQVVDDPWYAFNDFHGVVALSGAGRTDDARAVVNRLERYVVDGTPPRSNHMMTSEVGLPASRAVVAYAEGRHDDVVDELLPVRTLTNRFGGSHAQRDILHRTLTESAIRSGRHDLARALLDERLSQRDTSVYGLLGRARVLAMQGADADAARAREAADANRTRFNAAASS